ncbi:small ribosomal subunit protein uS7m-like [Sycon ciliatum]|uniref:small ribosomal subunit protein uS7m-like n=1 Tax=Sycon ciliatum TaxID=27933 RepID=UPI0020ACEF81|eukprot:scpid93536/ scgid13333/ 28S ribosomal protein S7, mitochondrial
MALPFTSTLRCTSGLRTPTVIFCRTARSKHKRNAKPSTRVKRTDFGGEDGVQYRPLRTTAARPEVDPSVFYDGVISKFVNQMMISGKKAIAREIVTKTLLIIKRRQLQKYDKAKPEAKENIELDPRVIFRQAVENCKPLMGFNTLKRGGKVFLVPVPFPDARRRYFAFDWMIDVARNKPHQKNPMQARLSEEILLAYDNQGAAIKKKEDFHKIAYNNRAFAHYRWW